MRHVFSIDDLADAHEYLDIKQEAEAYMAAQHKQAMQKGKG